MAQQKRGPINGLDPLIYTGGLPNLVIMDRRPTPYDYEQYFLGHWWIIPKTNDGSTPEKEIWILVGKQQNIATWKRLHGGGTPTNDFLVNIINITTPGAGVYTPTVGMRQCFVEIVGGGGGGGQEISLSQAGVCHSGGAGGYSAKLFTSEDIGSSQSYAVGAGGTTDNPGVTGGTTTFGSFLTATGGTGGYISAGLSASAIPNGLGGTGSGGDVNIKGGAGSFGYVSQQLSVGTTMVVGTGGDSYFAPGGAPTAPSFAATTLTGVNGEYGSGGGGVVWVYGGAQNITMNGGDGGDGYIRITEYLI